MGKSNSKEESRQNLKSKKKRSFFRRVSFQKHSEMNFYKDYLVQSPPLGKGDLGEIRIGKHVQLGELRIIKVIYENEDPKELELLEEELEILSDLDHPNIMKFYEQSRDVENGLRFIVLEYFIGKPLLDILRDEGGVMSENLVKKIMLQVLSFLSYIHSKGIVYRDLKLENILFNGETVKIMDFSLAKKVGIGKKMKVGVGVPSYVSPEMIKSRYDQRTDIWSFGVCIYTLLKGKYPFFGSSPYEVYTKIKKFDIEFQSDQSLSIQAKDMLERIFQKRPEKRISLAQLENDPFFKINNDVRKSKADQLKNFAFEAYQNMKDLDFSNQAQTSLYIMMCQNIQGPNHNKLQQLFNLIDVQKNGKINLTEFKTFFMEQQISNDEDEIEEIFNKIDLDDKKEMTFQEFIISAQSASQMIHPENIEKFFKYLSEGKDELDANDFKKIFEDIEEDKFKEIFGKIDQNKNGYIDINEFK